MGEGTCDNVTMRVGARTAAEASSESGQRAIIQRGAAVVVAGYLAVTTAPTAIAVARGAPGGVLLAHLLLLAASVIAARRLGSGAWRVVGDWLPLAAIPALYGALPIVMAGVSGGDATYHDGLVQRWERALFGDPSRTLAAAFPGRLLSESVHLAYLSYYALIYVPPLLLYARRRMDDFHRVATALLLTFVVCFAVFAVFPVQGPRYLGTAPAPDGPVRSLVLALLESGSSRGAAFPSSHVAVAVVQTALAVLRRARLAAVYAVLTAGLTFGAVYGGFHYAVDALAGAVLALVLVGCWSLASGRSAHRHPDAVRPLPRPHEQQVIDGAACAGDHARGARRPQPARDRGR